MKKIKVYELSSSDQKIIYTTPWDLASGIETDVDGLMEVGDSIELKVTLIEMTQEEFDNLKEFEG